MGFLAYPLTKRNASVDLFLLYCAFSFTFHLTTHRNRRQLGPKSTEVTREHIDAHEEDEDVLPPPRGDGSCSDFVESALNRDLGIRGSF